MTTLSEIGSHINIFFNDKYKMTEEARKILDNEKARKVIIALNEYLKTAKDNLQELYPAAIKYAKEKTGTKGKELFMPIRAALTGKTTGPELDKVFSILGKDTTLNRLKPFTG